jgi:hypothetical protein
MGFIQARDTASMDDAATRVRKALGEFNRKFWYFFAATLFFTGFFRLLQAPDTWVATLLLTAAQALVGAVLCAWMLRRLSTFAQLWRIAFLVFPVLPLALHMALHTPLSGLMIVALWAVFIYNYLWQAEIREAFGQPRQTVPRTVTEA